MLSVSLRKSFLLLPVVLLGILVLVACSSSTTSGTTTSHTTSTGNPGSNATAQAFQHLMTLVGNPTAKMVSGTTFEVDGQIKNGDSLQHDITVQATLLDASGKTIATATKLVDNVHGGATATFAIQGTAPQPDWSKVEVTVIKVSENMNGSGGD